MRIILAKISIALFLIGYVSLITFAFQFNPGVGALFAFPGLLFAWFWAIEELK